MYTQVELVSSNDDVYVYWLHNDLQTQPKLRTGLGVRLFEVDKYLRVNRVLPRLRISPTYRRNRLLGRLLK